VGKERSKRVVAGNDESSQVGQKLASEVEDNEEEVESAKADGSIGLGDTSLLLEVVKGGVLGKLLCEWHHRQHLPRCAICVGCESYHS
jgi:hypothetical protein